MKARSAKNHVPIFIALALVLALGCGPTGEITVEGGISEGPATNDDSDDGINLDPFITDGQVDPGHPTVAKLSGCTGTLIGKRTVLTAGHCVGYKGYAKLGGQTYYTSKIHKHPQYGGGNRNDVAVMILSQPVQGITPTPIATQAPTVGQAITLVGFGKTSEYGGGYGTKRFTTNTVGKVRSTTFSFYGKKTICNGDSGGPTFVQYGNEEVTIGVHSTKSGWCGNGGTDMRVDQYVQWIQQGSGGDVVLQGSGQQKPPPQQPPQNPNPPPGAKAAEGQSCKSNTCQAGLSCVTVISGTNTLGKWCMTKCTTIGSTTAPCNGGEKCLASSVGNICFNGSAPSTGYTSPGGSKPPPGGPNPAPTPPPQGTLTEGKSCASANCALGLACVTVASGKKTIGKYCMERCSALGSSAAPCDGGDICTNSSQGPVCFNVNKSSSGYTSPGNSGGNGGGGNGGGGNGGGGNGGGGNGGGSSGVCGGNEESEVFKLLNQTRAKYGRAPVSCDKKALVVARAHSQDMCDRGYFSHTNKQGQSAGQRLKAGGVSFSSWGENIAYGYSSPQSVTNGWMKSWGHRKNMLSSSWKRAAIGMIRCKGSTPYWTEVFMR